MHFSKKNHSRNAALPSPSTGTKFEEITRSSHLVKACSTSRCFSLQSIQFSESLCAHWNLSLSKQAHDKIQVTQFIVYISLKWCIFQENPQQKHSFTISLYRKQIWWNHQEKSSCEGLWYLSLFVFFAIHPIFWVVGCTLKPLSSSELLFPKQSHVKL